MKSIRIFMLLNLAIGTLAAISFTSGLASAQTVTGKFTLPFQAEWNSTTLPAGDYSFRLDETGPSAKVQVFRGAEHVAYLLSQDAKSSGKISLVVERTSAGSFVRDLNRPEIGVVLHYAPHTERGSAREREIARIPITTGTK